MSGRPAGGGSSHDLEKLARSFEGDVVRDVTVVDIPCDRPPWVPSGLTLEPGDRVSAFASGWTRLAGTDISIGPAFQAWYRIGDDGEIFRGPRASHTFEAPAGGSLQVASYYPGEWGTRQGALGVPDAVYAGAEGTLTVVLVRWNTEPLQGLRALAAGGDPSGLVASEIDRISRPLLPPDDWYYLWFLGPAEIYRSVPVPGRRNAIECRTGSDCGLLLRDVPFAFGPGTRLRWSWKVDQLPSAVAENTLPTHDYMSIAVEFDNGQDLTYFWSAALEPGTGFRCPIPLWDARETHVAVRSGSHGLGEWQTEERDLYADYVRYIGGPAGASIKKVWLIALTLFQRQDGRATFADISLVGPDGAVAEL